MDYGLAGILKNVQQIRELISGGSIGGGGSATATVVTAINASASNVQLMAANSSRIGFAIYNNGSTTLYVRLGTTAATTSLFTVAIPVGGLYEAPTGWATLAVQGIWAGSPTGNAMITEVV